MKQHWTAQVPNEGGVVTAKFSIYHWEDGYRIMVTLPKQKIYFQIMGAEPFNLLTLVEHFNANRLDMDHARCVRCGKWQVVSGLYCDRCTDVVNRGMGNEWYELSADGAKRKLTNTSTN